jgi:phosphatidylglycerol:prolipoprotein diacylglycerol transferase
MLAILFPQINPIFLNFFSIKIHWYSIAYIVGILFGYVILKRLNDKKPQVFTSVALDDLILYSVLGIIVGGRLGYIFFYDFFYAIKNPIFIFQTWKGGMSFHGGLIGIAISTYVLAKKHKINFFKAVDLICCVAPIGIFLGRIANFVNSELYGRVTDVPWAVIFPNGGYLPRHPSQIYEAICEGILLFIIMILFFYKTNFRHIPGKITGCFLISYSFFRMILESFREPDAHVGYILNIFTLGQILSLPLLMVGLILVYRKK